MYFDGEFPPIEGSGSSPLGFVSSSIGILQVYGYTQREGEQGVPPHSPAISSPPSPSLYRQRRHKLHRRNKTCSLRRTLRYAPGEVLATLEFVTPLTDVCHDWDPTEIKAGRRLVRFCSIQEGHRLVVSCGRITPDEYRPTDNVASCIYREDVNDYFITSVDIIHLLQKLVGEEFAVMEKNRIRRNLEGLHPVTVSKHRPGVDTFFQRIMDFPDPKPRNIEKDLKVFRWSLLPQALEKIVSKYSLHTVEQHDSPQPEFSPVYADSLSVSEATLTDSPLVSPISVDGCYNYVTSPTVCPTMIPTESSLVSPISVDGCYNYDASPTVCSTIGVDYFSFLEGPSIIQESISNGSAWVSDLITDGIDNESGLHAKFSDFFA